LRFGLRKGIVGRRSECRQTTTQSQGKKSMRIQRGLVRLPILALTIVLVQGCAAVTHFEAVSPGTTLTLRGGERMELPKEVQLESKATGQYEFLATAPSGKS